MANPNYYYLVSSLPKLRLDDYNEHYRLGNFIEDLEKHLTDEHLSFARDILYTYDNEIIIDVLLGYTQPRFNRQGNWKFDEVKKILQSDEDIFPGYINKFLLEYNQIKKENIINRADLEDKLFSEFYQKMTHHKNQFISEYFMFERNLRNVLVALNKKKFNISTDQYLGSAEDEVISALKLSSLGDFGLSGDLDFISGLIERFQSDDIVNFEKYLDQLRWNRIDYINTLKYFEIDVLLGYLIKIMLVERWIALDVQTGGDIFKQRTTVSLAAA